MDINKSKIYEPVKESGRNGSKVIQTSPLFREGHDLDLKGSEKHGIKDLICFSHLRWNFVFQRPQHLLTRWARECRVFYFEEPIRGNFDTDYLKTVYSNSGLNLTIITPFINESRDAREVNRFLTQSVKEIIKWYQVEDYLLWYLTPMAVEFAADLDPEIIVYDSMDELSCFKGAHPNMIPNENMLLELADVVFTGGFNLYEYKKNRHNNIHPFPSSIDQKHFESGIGNPDPADQSHIPHPRVGFFGVIDERLDIDLLSELALRMPDVQFVMIGPVVKIDPEILPKHKNIHYLGQKSYGELPNYLANWDVAILPFAKNDSTRFISPTKTPEYLSAGRPVVSTSIRDVVVPYGEMGLVEIADNAADFAEAIQRLLNMKDKAGWSAKVKEHLKGNSWDLTWARMREVIYKTLEQKKMGLESAFNGFTSGSAK
jgi:UDP-galactopyranose mutase